MPMEGVQQAEIIRTSVFTKDNGTVDVNVRLALADHSEISAHVYITEKSKGIARAALKKCGFNPDVQDVWDLEENPMLLNGNEVQVDIFTDEYQGKRRLKAEIVLEKVKPDEKAVKKATSLLREAKSKDDASAEGAQKIIEGFPRSSVNDPQPPPDTEPPF